MSSFLLGIGIFILGCMITVVFNEVQKSRIEIKNNKLKLDQLLKINKEVKY